MSSLLNITSIETLYYDRIYALLGLSLQVKGYYRDPDVGEYDACFCGLYVSERILRGEKKFTSIPERRPGADERAQSKPGIRSDESDLAFPVWRCKVCGYLCARDKPPETCPICKVGKERFERFM